MEPGRTIGTAIFSLMFLAGIAIGAWVITESETAERSALLSAVATALPPTPVVVEQPALSQFIEVMDGCDMHYTGECVVARAEPASTSPTTLRLRKGMVLEIASTTVTNADGEWYRVIFSEWLRYPYRVDGEWYVEASSVRTFPDVGALDLVLEAQQHATSTKRIVIDRSEQKLFAYEGDTLFLATPISTGLDLTPTPRGSFMVYRKTPSRYMQGPLPGISDQYYDLPGVPWDLYFTEAGGAIHGAYWHNSFGEEWSHGCVNVPLVAARTLYYWTPLATPVTVVD